MFKKKSLLSELFHPSGSDLFLLASLMFSLSSETAYSAPPVKDSTVFVISSGEAPALPDTEELGATGITNSGATGNATGLDAPVAGTNTDWPTNILFLELSPSLLAETSSYSVLPPLESANHAPPSGQGSMPPGAEYPGSLDEEEGATGGITIPTETGTWLDHFSMLLSELNNEAAQGTNNAFPALELVNPSLQQMGLSNALQNNMLLNDTLFIIKTNSENYTVFDLYYVLWLIAKHNGAHSLMKVLRLNALILKRHLDLGRVAFHKLSGDDPAREVLFDSLALLQKALSQDNSSREVAAIMTRFVFNGLYRYLHSKATDAFEQEVTSLAPGADHILTFLYELDQISSQFFDGKNYVESNNLAYARSRAWHFLFDQFGHRDRSPQQSSDLYSAHISLTALYTLFIGKPDMAYRMLEKLARVERDFAKGYYTHDLDSIVRWVIRGNLRMFDPSEYDMIVKALFSMARNPFPPSTLHQTPNTIILAGDPDTLRAIQKELSLAYSEHSHLLNINPALLYQLETSEVFEVVALPPIIERQEKARQEQDKKKPLEWLGSLLKRK